MFTIRSFLQTLTFAIVTRWQVERKGGGGTSESDEGGRNYKILMAVDGEKSGGEHSTFTLVILDLVIPSKGLFSFNASHHGRLAFLLNRNKIYGNESSNQQIFFGNSSFHFTPMVREGSFET